MSNIVDSDFRYPIVFEDADGVPQDVSSWTFEVRWYRGSDGLLVHTLSDGIDLESDGTDGAVALVLSAAQTKLIGPGNNRVVCWKTNGERKVLFEGTVPFEALSRDAT